jgi:hypothetical protein
MLRRISDFWGKRDWRGSEREGWREEEQKSKRPIEAAFKEIARRLEIAPEVLRGKERR